MNDWNNLPAANVELVLEKADLVAQLAEREAEIARLRSQLPPALVEPIPGVKVAVTAGLNGWLLEVESQYHGRQIAVYTNFEELVAGLRSQVGSS